MASQIDWRHFILAYSWPDTCLYLILWTFLTSKRSLFSLVYIICLVNFNHLISAICSFSRYTLVCLLQQHLLSLFNSRTTPYNITTSRSLQLLPYNITTSHSLQLLQLLHRCLHSILKWEHFDSHVMDQVVIFDGQVLQLDRGYLQSQVHGNSRLDLKLSDIDSRLNFKWTQLAAGLYSLFTRGWT